MDPAELRTAPIDRASLARIWRFISPYKVMLGLYLLAIVALAAIGVILPLLVRRLIDHAIPFATAYNHDFNSVNLLAAGMVGLALATTGISLLNRWFASRIGEGLIYDLRTALYDHVQRMPIAFFTPTQTGSLMSRLTNDVLDAQNSVGTVASVLSDVMTLVTTLVVMFALSPGITLLALLVLPPFVLLDRLLS